MTTLAELLNALDADAIKNALLAQLQENDFPTTSWASGDPERTLIEAEAATQVDLWALVPKIAAGALIDLAESDWLTLLAAQRYSLTRTAATATEGTILLTCSAAAGPYTIAVGQLQFQGAGGNLYRNTSGGVLASPGTLYIYVKAESPGADEGNDGAATITTITTPLAGVTCTNPATTFSTPTLIGTSTGTVTPTFGTPSSKSWVIIFTSTGDVGVANFQLSDDGGLTYGAAQATGGAMANVDGTGINLAFANGSGTPNSFVIGDSFTFTSSGTWYTSQGTDEETDANLRQRCKARWPDLSETPTDEVYEALAKAASSAVTRVRVYADNVIPAKVNVIVAGPAGPVSVTVEGAVQDYIDARVPLTDVPLVATATAQVITLAGATVRVKSRNLSAAQVAAQANVAAYIATAGIGDGANVYLRYSQFIEAILRESGDEDDSITGLTLNGGAVDLLIPTDKICTWSQAIATALTWTTY